MDTDPDASGLTAVLHGELAAIIAVCAAASGHPGRELETLSQLSVVAGARSHLYRTTNFLSQR